MHSQRKKNREREREGTKIEPVRKIDTETTVGENKNRKRRLVDLISGCSTLKELNREKKKHPQKLFAVKQLRDAYVQKRKKYVFIL